MAETLPEIAEADATGEIAALYETIRSETGSSIVNYVWRHLATVKGAAPWAWAFSQVNDSEELAREIAEFADQAASRVAVAFPPPQQVDLTETATSIVQVYNANNARNLARVMLLRQALLDEGLLDQGPSAANSGGSRVPQPRRPSGARLPPLPRFAELTDAARRSIERISSAGPAADSGLTPSLWRHLAIEPGLLSRLEAPLEATQSSEAFHTAFSRLRKKAASWAQRQAIVLPGPAEFDRNAAIDGIDRFSRRIAELTLAGRIVALWSRPR